LMCFSLSSSLMLCHAFPHSSTSASHLRSAPVACVARCAREVAISVAVVWRGSRRSLAWQPVAQPLPSSRPAWLLVCSHAQLPSPPPQAGWPARRTAPQHATPSGAVDSVKSDSGTHFSGLQRQWLSSARKALQELVNAECAKLIGHSEYRRGGTVGVVACARTRGTVHTHTPCSGCPSDNAWTPAQGAGAAQHHLTLEPRLATLHRRTPAQHPP
jgi:hypothetical protein